MQIVSLDKIPVLPRLSEDKLEGMNLSANEFVKEALCQMRNLCYSLDGVGLHAVQVGLPFNMFVAQVSNFGLPPTEVDLEFFASCKYEGIGEKINSVEGCLSIKDENGSILYVVKRYYKIILKGYKYNRNQEFVYTEQEFQGFPAIVLQHEIDHGDNILISDIGEKFNVER